MSENKSFEEELAKLETIGQRLTQGDLTLDQALKEYEAGIGHYRRCLDMLNQAKEKMEVYDRSGEEQ